MTKQYRKNDNFLILASRRAPSPEVYFRALPIRMITRWLSMVLVDQNAAVKFRATLSPGDIYMYQQKNTHIERI